MKGLREWLAWTKSAPGLVGRAPSPPLLAYARTDGDTGESDNGFGGAAGDAAIACCRGSEAGGTLERMLGGGPGAAVLPLLTKAGRAWACPRLAMVNEVALGC